MYIRREYSLPLYGLIKGFLSVSPPAFFYQVDLYLSHHVHQSSSMQTSTAQHPDLALNLWILRFDDPILANVERIP